MQAAPCILVVDDERDLVELIEFNLRKAGYRTVAAHTGKEALRVLEREPPDAVILDLMMPQMDGIEFTMRVRTSPALAGLPILMLTAKGEEVDQVAGLSMGADDYMPKPFSMKVLLARVAALLRRSASGPSAQREHLELGPICIEVGTHEVRAAGEEVKLTLTEFRVLAALLQAEGKVLSRSALIARAIGPGITVTERTIDVHVTAIRKKLGEAGRLIHTVRGVGYRASLHPLGEARGSPG